MNILITESKNYSEPALKLYEQVGTVIKSANNREQLVELIPKIDILVLRLSYNIDKDILKHATKLKYIVTPTTGLNHIDLALCDEIGIQVISLKGEFEFLNRITPTAELTWGLLLSLIRKIPSACKDVCEGNWERDSHWGMELYGKTLGIIGYGRLGRMVGQYGNAFGMDVIYYDVADVKSDCYSKYEEIDDLLAASDVISVHIPLDASNTYFMDEDKIKKIKKGAVFINSSRGEVLCEDALLQSLKTKMIVGAALDVLSDEVSNDSNWIRNNQLWQYAKVNDNLLITPHIGGACPESMKRTELFCVRKLISIMAK